jgi:mannose-6-phosphate isomerase-like protein (cupin superfamily)
MTDTTTMNPAMKPSADELMRLHEAADAQVVPYSYRKPEAVATAKGRVNLAKTECLRGVVQIVKKNGGENNLHYHTNSDSFWMVLKGRIRFYGPDDKLIGEFGPHEGTVTPRYSRYWFENAGEEDAELLQIAALHRAGLKETSGRTDLEPQRFKIGNTQKFDGTKR